MLETRDPDVADSIVREQYTSVAMLSHGERFVFRIEQAQVGAVRMDDTTFGLALTYRAAPMGTLCIGMVRGGSATYEFGPRIFRRGRGDVFLVAPADESFHGSVDHLHAEFAVFTPGLLAQVAATAPGSREPVRLLDLDPVSAQAAARWRHAYGVTRAVSRVSDSPLLVTTHAARFLAAVTLATFPNTALTDPTIEDRHDAHPETVRRAIAFMEEAPARDLTVVDIAEAASVSVRAVQLAFRRHLGTTPMAYLRRLRLEGVRDELLAAQPRDTTVTAVAARWGFLNSSRFATQYREAFDQLPSDTLHS
ncbi:helix-turn-helix domain-containing protein [Paractinoplanes deccanensis]|uniref:helix-turn-helix domain-containing protein n=1 Tax=Paractinoplanes deccanensis TaxID=113561 RepID=UPI001EF2530E|nr:helix-turn-helix domain-containing protein [Actinoplanes deccanensis]